MGGRLYSESPPSPRRKENWIAPNWLRSAWGPYALYYVTYCSYAHYMGLCCLFAYYTYHNIYYKGARL